MLLKGAYCVGEHFVDPQCALAVNKCEFSVHTVRIFMKCTHVCAAQ